MTYAIFIAIGLLLLLAIQWCFLPHGRVPRFRVRYLRVRLWLRLHPGRGHAKSWRIRSLGPVPAEREHNEREGEQHEREHPPRRRSHLLVGVAGRGCGHRQRGEIDTLRRRGSRLLLRLFPAGRQRGCHQQQQTQTAELSFSGSRTSNEGL